MFRPLIEKVRTFRGLRPRLTKILGILLILFVIPLTVLAALTIQNLRQRASGTGVQIVDINGNYLPTTSDTQVYLRINLPENWVSLGMETNKHNIINQTYAQTTGGSCTPPYDGFQGCFNTENADPPSNYYCAGSCTTSAGELGQYCYTSTKVGNKCSDDSGASGICNTYGDCEVSASAPTPIPSAIPTPILAPAYNPPTTITSPTPVPSVSPSSSPPPALSITPSSSPTPTPNILRAIYIENKDTDGSTGGSTSIRITVNRVSDIARIAWKLNDLLPGQTQAPRTVQVTLIGDTITVPFTAIVNLVKLNDSTVNTQLGPNVFMLEDDGNLSEAALNYKVMAITKKFYENYPDQYDFIGIHFKKQVIDFAYFVSVKRLIKGAFVFEDSDHTAEYGSRNRLLGIYVDGFSIDNVYVKRPPTNSAVEYLNTFYFGLLFHEFAHYWGTYLPDELKEALRGGYGIKGQPLEKTYEQGHWESFIGSWISVSPREKIIQNSEGKYYLKNDCISGNIKHHDFDLYSMGLKSAEDIKEKLIVVKYPPFIEHQSLCGTYEVPASEIERVFTIQDMIKILGPRIPSTQNSQKNFNIAFVLIIPKGTTANKEEIDALNWIANKFPIAWYQSTEGRSILNGIKPKDITPPVISDVKTSATKSSITVSWNTDEPTSPIVIYRAIDYPLSLVYPNVITNPPKFSTSHTIKIEPTDWRTPVKPNTEHSITILSVDEDYNTASFDAGKIITIDTDYDLNKDGAINCNDTKILVGQWGQKGTTLSADFNRDGIVNEIDYNTILKNYTPGDTTACPQ